MGSPVLLLHDAVEDVAELLRPLRAPGVQPLADDADDAAAIRAGVRKVSTLVIPDFVISLMARFQVPMKVPSTMVGLRYHRDSTKARRPLGWNPRPVRETVLDATSYLIDNGIV